jgi:hypothetical protein
LEQIYGVDGGGLYGKVQRCRQQIGKIPGCW